MEEAYTIANEAGTILGNPGVQYHVAKQPGFYNHYHPGAKYSKPHVFYGTAL